MVSSLLFADFNLDCLFSPSSPPLISSFPFGLPYVEVYPVTHQAERIRPSIWDLTTRSSTHNERLISHVATTSAVQGSSQRTQRTETSYSPNH